MMVNSWLTEGFIQLSLGLAWETLATGLTSVSADLAGRLRRLILEPFLCVEWMPGIREAIDKIKLHAATDTSAAFTYPDRIRATFLGSWPGELDRISTNGDALEHSRHSIRKLLLCSCESTVRAAEAPHGVPPRTVNEWPSQPVVEHLSPADMALAWICEARAISAWPALADEVADLRQKAERHQRWTELRSQCEKVEKQLAEVQVWGKSRLRRLLSTGSLLPALEGAGLALAQCREVFTELIATNHLVSAARPDQPTDKLRQRIQGLLQQTSTDWEVRQLIDLCCGLGVIDPDHCGGLLNRIWPAVEATSVWSEWGRSLARDLPETTTAGKARLILLRSIIEAMGCCALANSVLWKQFQDAAHGILARDGLESLLIHETIPEQADWYLSMVDSSLESTRPGSAGLVIRYPGGPWCCFPRAVQHVPVSVERNERSDEKVTSVACLAAVPQTPEERALAALDALSEEATVAPSNSSDSQESAAETTMLSAQRAQEVEEKWTKLSQELREAGFEAVPSSWTFLRPVSWHELHLDENDFSPVFRGNIPREIAFRVKVFGLRQPSGETIRPCVVYVSAGPSPAGFDELYRLVEKPTDPGEEGLKLRLRGWPRACLLDAFDVAAERLFIDFWSPLCDEMRAKNPEGARRFAELLSSLLEKHLSLHTFLPDSYQDYPAGWILVGSEQGGVTGNVRRVIRPGLTNEDGKLQIAAIVEID